MLFEEQDREKLKKLNVKNIIDLALTVPVSYENYFISSIPKASFQNVVNARIISRTDNGKYLKIRLYAKNFGFNINAIVFNPKRYHRSVFKTGANLYLKGKLEHSMGMYQMAQPLVIGEIDKIVPKYKTPLQKKTVTALMKKYLNEEALIKEGLDAEKAKIFLDIHFPSERFCDLFEKNGFSDETLKTLKFAEIYSHLKQLSSKKRFFKAKKKLEGSEDELIKNLPFDLTGDQLVAIEDIKKDLKSETAAKRVIMGDVGCGKTIVMLACAMIAYPSRVFLMAPTTILSFQIYEEAQKYLPDFVKTTFLSSREKGVNLKEYDFIIGTHALLYQELPEADLVMIDEQHRFGTNQREMIKQLLSHGEKRPHFLQFSATPIPRTMSMINSSLVDYTFIKELPYKKDINTKIISKEHFKDLLAHIKAEIKKDHQIVIIYPLVKESENIEYQSIEEAKGYWLRNFKNVYVTHGQDKEKEQVLKDFRDNGDILLATTLVEVGISLPRLTTVVIVGAERLGLSTLHQLRGRVSRTGLKGYCYLYTNTKQNKRLEEFSKTLNGFDIAELDLKYRQSGDLIKGEAQSGKSFKWIDMGEDVDIVGEAKRVL